MYSSFAPIHVSIFFLLNGFCLRPSVKVLSGDKTLGRKKIETWIGANEEYIPFASDEVRRNYQRNSMLIDLSNTPKDIEEKILDEYKRSPSKNRKKLLNYFMKYRLKELTENIGEF